jgi:hypothetical protein
MTRADLTEEVCQAWLPWTEQSPIVASPRGGVLVMWPTGTPHLRTTGDDGHNYPLRATEGWSPRAPEPWYGHGPAWLST